MDGLRWLLLLFGLLVIAGVYFYSRRESKQPKEELPTGRVEPTLGAEEAEAVAESEAIEDPGEEEEPEAPR